MLQGGRRIGEVESDRAGACKRAKVVTNGDAQVSDSGNGTGILAKCRVAGGLNRANELRRIVVRNQVHERAAHSAGGSTHNHRGRHVLLTVGCRLLRFGLHGQSAPSKPYSTMTLRSFARGASLIGNNGKRNSSRHSPIMDTAALTGMGLVSRKRARMSGSSR